jgi:hypothetical protein
MGDREWLLLKEHPDVVKQCPYVIFQCSQYSAWRLQRWPAFSAARSGNQIKDAGTQTGTITTIAIMITSIGVTTATAISPATRWFIGASCNQMSYWPDLTFPSVWREPHLEQVAFLFEDLSPGCVSGSVRISDQHVENVRTENPHLSASSNLHHGVSATENQAVCAPFQFAPQLFSGNRAGICRQICR